MDDVRPWVDVVGLEPLVGFERKPFRPFSLVTDRDVAGRSESAPVGAELRRESASSAVPEREWACHLGDSGVFIQSVSI